MGSKQPAGCLGTLLLSSAFLDLNDPHHFPARLLLYLAGHTEC